MKTSFFWGIIIVLIGLVLLLNNLGITDLDIGQILTTYWPAIFMFWGVEALLERKNRNNNPNLIFGGILLVLGLAIIGRNLGYYNFDFSILWNVLWPLLLILIGVNILKSRAFTEEGNLAIMSGIEKKRNGWKLTDKSYFALMGGIDLDMTIADIPEGETNLELTAIMAGIEIIAPKNVTIICKNTSILGGINFFHDDSGGIFMNKKYERKADIDTDKKIIIYSRCIMGGIDIK